MSGAAARIEPRWPVALAIVATASLLAMLPGRVRILPIWVPQVLSAIVLVPLAGVRLSGGRPEWRRIERIAILVFFVIGVVSLVANLASLTVALVGQTTPLEGLQLLESSVAIWVINVLVFSLLYWQMDRGGPDSRMSPSGVKPDWLFPQDGVLEHVGPDWHPTYVDYLFLGYSTATAFSPTDALPLTARAKLLMMTQSSISLVTIIVIAARSINILGS